MSSRLLEAPPATLCGYCGRALTPHPPVAGGGPLACPRCLPLLDATVPDLVERERSGAVLAWFRAAPPILDNRGA